jgi:hypothetical protein
LEREFDKIPTHRAKTLKDKQRKEDLENKIEDSNV